MSKDCVEEVEIGDFELVDYAEGVIFSNSHVQIYAKRESVPVVFSDSCVQFNGKARRTDTLIENKTETELYDNIILEEQRNVPCSSCQCSECALKFESPHEWNQHVTECHNISLASKNGTGKFDCSQCDAAFTRKNNLLRHFRKFHRDIAPPFRRLTYMAGYYLECPVCEGKFTRKSNLLRHIRRFHEDLVPAVINQSPKVYACPECNTGFTKWNNCKRHIRHFHGSEGLIKNPIKRLFDSESPPKKEASDESRAVLSADDSNEVETPPIFPCSDCDLSFTTSQGLTRHTELVHAVTDSKRSKSSDVKKCPLCSFCDTKLNLYIHFTSVHDRPILIECHDFDTLVEFEEWRAQVESDTDTHFAGAAQKPKIGQQSRVVFACSHSKNAGQGEKQDGFCPAEITLVMNQKKCSVYFVKTHVGHATADCNQPDVVGDGLCEVVTQAEFDNDGSNVGDSDDVVIKVESGNRNDVDDDSNELMTNIKITDHDSDAVSNAHALVTKAEVKN